LDFLLPRICFKLHLCNFSVNITFDSMFKCFATLQLFPDIKRKQYLRLDESKTILP